MKKTKIAILLAALLVSTAACTKTPAPSSSDTSSEVEGVELSAVTGTVAEATEESVSVVLEDGTERVFTLTDETVITGEVLSEAVATVEYDEAAPEVAVSVTVETAEKTEGTEDGAEETGEETPEEAPTEEEAPEETPEEEDTSSEASSK